jgi:endonuclease-3
MVGSASDSCPGQRTGLYDSLMPRPNRKHKQEHARRIVAALAREYPQARCALHHANPLQLLVATILSAQCTDARVNQVTPALFRRYPDAAAFAQADPRELERLIQSTGFFRSKAKNIIGCCRGLVEKHNGQVPADLEALVALPGVGRKTANVVLGDCFGIPGVVVDTHVKRLSRRLGLTRALQPEKIEQELMQLVPAAEWTQLGHRLIHHGRAVCVARKPKCGACVLASLCPQVGVSQPASSQSKGKQ